MELKELVAKLSQQQLVKKDFIINSSMIGMVNGQMVLSMQDRNSKELNDLLMSLDVAKTFDEQKKIYLDVSDVANENICSKLGIPAKYYKRCSGEHLRMRDSMVSYWMKQKSSNFLLRTLADENDDFGYLRSLLSDKYYTIDNYDVLIACLDAVRESGLDLKIENCQLTERNMYVSFIAPSIVQNAPELLKNYRVPNKPTTDMNDGIITGFTLANSEVGQGSFRIMPRALVLVCRNGMVRNTDAFVKNHIGSKMGDGNIEWSSETKRKDYELIISQTKDAINKFCSEEYLGDWVHEMIQKGEKQLEHPMDCVVNVTNRLGFSEQKENEILNHFLKGNDFTRFGVTQALTYYAQSEDGDERYSMEKASLEILDEMDTFDKPRKKKSVSQQLKLN